MLKWSNIKFRLSRRFYPLAIKWWVAWSGLYRRLYNKKHEKISLEHGLGPRSLQYRFSKLQWKPDGPRQLWDACSSPQYVQSIVNRVELGYRQLEGPLDCDEYAVWAANVIGAEYRPRVLSVMWQDLSGNIHGHSVCLCTDNYNPHRYCHIGNWGFYNYKFGYQQHIRDMIRSGNLIGWALFSKDLKILKIGDEI